MSSEYPSAGSEIPKASAADIGLITETSHAHAHAGGHHGHHGVMDRKRLAGLTLAAVGVVFGDIGTSPLYTIREIFHAGHATGGGMDISPFNVLGILSLVFWAMTIVVTLKYVTFLMRADNDGEGGVLALTSLAMKAVENPRLRYVLLMLGLAGTALFFGDSMITPAISVLSAVEGLNVATKTFEPMIIPITVVIITGLFAVQSFGTAKVGAYFGPITSVWFLVLALIGIGNILSNPGVLAALNPFAALGFIAENPGLAFAVMGSVVLAITGGEALYTDMGHFGRFPIRAAWYGMVMPSLLLNYFGQGAFLLANPTAESLANPFYLSAPDWMLYPLVILATLATIIASQAVISGAFSIARQANLLGFSPRLRVLNTSEKEKGQIYLPQVNWFLYVSVILLVVSFRSSSALASAYGIAVTGTMLIDSILFAIVARKLWQWPLWSVCATAGMFMVVDVTFFAGNVPKIPHGAWFPLLIGGIFFLMMTTWKRGRALMLERSAESGMSLRDIMPTLSSTRILRVPGTAVFMTPHRDAAPAAVLHNLKHNKVLHENIVFMTVKFEDVPYVDTDNLLEVDRLAEGVSRVVVHYGFMQSPNLPKIMEMCRMGGIVGDMMTVSFFVGRESLRITRKPGMSYWRKHLFAAMHRNAITASDFFRIPSNRVVELGAQVDL